MVVGASWLVEVGFACLAGGWRLVAGGSGARAWLTGGLGLGLLAGWLAGWELETGGWGLAWL